MKLVVSKEEIEKVKKYWLFVETNPCLGCASNNGFCQGCSKAISWEASAKAQWGEVKDIIGADCPGGEVVKKYCEIGFSLDKLREQRARLNQQIFKTEIELNQMLEHKIEIREDIEDDD